ncbi:hypothetical protein CC85DRAFT_116289 [Cutaneotrichosporon oleaginosum]|uniref:Uncharacterized protein n=1 Tax=Cutaneotrichosporon oleaginosum TaxID=879819 RepID=A0A0J1BCJ4_9TREE|nr:uncharacterized protein CC85DRAFT_116289 [Cutaneotrichosporon oleaginosum]KLT45744.1 hypothetical protein CC85DRAFT_116289 [Cutaneotrichosporon oleaginosum]TXT04489.1 hypothetical protein COLE_07308 [Cutaneotrichosporon oleaginosum]
MGNTTSTSKPLRRLSRASVSSTGASSTGVVDEQLPVRPPQDEEHDDFDETFDVPTFSTRRPLRRHSAPDDDTDTLCDSASIMTAFTDATLTADPLQAYVAGSSVVSAAVDAAMDVLNGNAKGWRRDVALAQLEWLAADGARRARWVRSEAAARTKRAKGRRASLGAPKRVELRLSTAGEERVVAEDAATARRVQMEAAAGDQRAGAEEDAKLQLERAHDAIHEHGHGHGHGHGHHEAGGERSGAGAGGAGGAVEAAREGAGNGDRAQVYATKRGQLRAAEERYHAACAEAAKEHSAMLAHAALAHERAFSSCKVTYMGKRLREPDAQGDLTFTAAAGAAVESKQKRSAWSGQYQVGQWRR